MYWIQLRVIDVAHSKSLLTCRSHWNLPFIKTCYTFLRIDPACSSRSRLLSLILCNIFLLFVRHLWASQAQWHRRQSSWEYHGNQTWMSLIHTFLSSSTSAFAIMKPIMSFFLTWSTNYHMINKGGKNCCLSLLSSCAFAVYFSSRLRVNIVVFLSGPLLTLGTCPRHRKSIF